MSLVAPKCTHIGSLNILMRSVDMLRKAGLPEVADDAQRELPDPVDSEQVAAWAVPYGINMGELMDRLGGSL